MSSQQRAGIVLILSAIAVVVLVQPFIIGLLGSLVLAVIAAPIYHRMRVRRHPRLAAALVVAGAVALVVAPGAALLLIAVDQIPDAIRWIEQSGMRERIASVHIGGADVGARIAEAGDAALSWISRHAMSFAGGMVQATINLVIAMFGLYYLLLDGERLWSRIRGAIPFSPAVTEHLRERFRAVTHATILGTVAIAVLQGGVAGAAFAVVGLPHPVMWGVLTAFGAVVPVVGSGLVWIPATALLLVTQRYGEAIALGVIGAIVVANVDNVVRPLIYRRISRVHPMITLVGAFAGIRFFGVLGVLFGPLGLAYFFELLGIYRREFKAVEHPGGDRVPGTGSEGRSTSADIRGQTSGVRRQEPQPRDAVAVTDH